MARPIGADPETLNARVAELHEFNPMLGHRGCRLGDLLSRDLRDAGRGPSSRRRLQVTQETGDAADARDHDAADRDQARARILRRWPSGSPRVCREVEADAGRPINYLVGTMIELPRAALLAGRHRRDAAEFFSFGTNDLTQTVLRHLPRRCRRASSATIHGQGIFAARSVRHASIPMASASWCASPPSAAARPGPI